MSCKEPVRSNLTPTEVRRQRKQIEDLEAQREPVHGLAHAFCTRTTLDGYDPHL